MIKLMRAASAFCFCILAFAAGDASAAPKHAAGRATIYFLRPNGPVVLYSPDVQLDGHKVGELRGGTYFVVTTSSGHHVLSIPNVAGFWQGEISLAAGETRYIALGNAQWGSIGYRALTALLTNPTGRLMPGGGFNSAYSFYALDPAQGRAMVATLRRVGAR